MRSIVFCCATSAIFGTGIAPDFVLAKQRTARHEIRGAAWVNERELWTWGERLERWRLPQWAATTLGRFATSDGGCVVDLNGDGLMDVAAPTAQGLAWFRAPRWEREILDADARTFECLGVELLGRRGLLVIHLGAQVRFYERPGRAGERWPYREIYSFYTASYQGGLLVRDVDGDGRRDIVCGNYWIRSPEQFDLPWTLYAINTWSEQPLSAAARLAWIGKTLLWAESRMSPARVALFHPPADPRQLWEPAMLELSPRALAYPRGVDSWGESFFIVGESNGVASRLLTFTPRGEARVLERGHPVRHVLSTAAGFAAIGSRRVAFYRKAPR